MINLSKIGSSIYILKIVDKSNWKNVSSNNQDIDFLKEHLDKVNWDALSCNPNAVDILDDNLDKINYNWLSSNKNATHLLKDNIMKIDWYNLASNENAIDLLEKHLMTTNDPIIWFYLSTNPNIFTYDYQSMRNRCDIYQEQLIKNRFHPDNFGKFQDWGFGVIS